MQTISKLSRIPKLTYLLLIMGFVSLLFYYVWWFQAERMFSPWLVVSFMAAFCYSIVQVVGSWLLYMAAHYVDPHKL